MTIKCKNQSLWTWDDIKAGRTICFKCLTLAVLLVITLGLAIVNFYSGVISTGNTMLIGWLLVVIAAVIYFKMANEQTKINDSYLKLTPNGIALINKGKRVAFESFDSIKLKRASWTQNYQGLYPAFEIHGQKLGNIRIGLSQENMNWVHLKTIFNDVHYTIDDKNSWQNFESVLRQYL